MAATNITDSSATITWTTDIAASSLVNYGVTTSFGSSSALNPALVTQHSITLNGLNANTLYNFDVVSSASNGTPVTSANFRFATLSTAPVIGDINVTYLTSTGVTINWTTDQPSTSMVNYGTTTNYGSSTPVISTPTIAHSVTLTGLAPNTTYGVAVVSSVGSMGAPSTSTNQSFTTAVANATPPSVSFLSSWGVTNSGATITWSTDVPANTSLAYGTTPALGQITPVQTPSVASHGVTLTGLNPGTTYYFIAMSSGSDGATGYSTLYNFTTTGAPPQAPVISNVTSSNLTTTSATITWTTDVPSNSLVNFGTTTSYSSSMLDSHLTKAHSVTLTGLASGTLYAYQVSSANPVGVSTFGADLSGFTIWAWGDSQTLGGKDGSPINYPASLSTDLGVPVMNEGVGGNTSTQIAQRMLATPASFTAGNCHVIWSGSNNPTEVSQILSDVASMINALESPKCFLILGDVNQVVSPLGSSFYNSIVTTNTDLASQYGNNYLNIREILVQAYNPALPLDVADHANDIPPSSLRAVVALGTITSGVLNTQSCAFSVSNGTQGPGTVVIVDSETILINAMSDNLTITGCVRGYNGTAAASHAANATYSEIDGTHVGANGLQFVAAQVASWFQSQSWPLCGGTSICPFPTNFTTLATNLPNPVISAVTVSNVTSTSAVVNWTTDQPATSLVNYGVNTTYGSVSTLDPTAVTSHSVALAGLTPNSTYNFDVVSANSARGSSTSANSTFTTGSAAALVISNVGTTNLTPTSVTINWTTSQPATAQVNYGATTAYGTRSAPTTTQATSQSVTLTGLTPNTAYDYQVISSSPSGPAATSTNYTFTTPAIMATPPYVGYVQFWGINNTGVTISWSTDVIANTVVAYGTTPALGQTYTNTSAGAISTANHGAVLTNLTPGTTYYFVAQSTGANGATGYSATYSFTTTGTAPTGPSFNLSATAATAKASSTGTSTLTVTPLRGFNSAVTLAASAWPAGITGTFGTNPATASSLVTISVGAGIAAGPYTLTVSGSSGALSASTTIALNVSTGSSTPAPPTFTTYLGTYGSAQPAYSGASTVLQLRGYLPAGASQIGYLIANINAASGGATEYQITAQSDNAGGYNLRVTNGTAIQPAWPFLTMSQSGATVTLSTPITVGAFSITAYRFALVGGEMQLDLTVTRSGTFSDQVVIFGVSGTNYSAPWGAVDGTWASSAVGTPSVTLSPSILTFGSQTAGTSITQSVTVTNSGSAALSITSAQVSGTNTSDFTVSNGCTSSVAAGASCTLSVTFDPAAAGLRSATLSIADNVSGSPQTVPLSGTGSAVPMPTTFTTYLGAYGSGQPIYNGNSTVLPLRTYIPGGASQISYLIANLNAPSGGATEFQVTAETDNAGGYNLRLTNGTTIAPAWPFLTMSQSGTTVTLATPITVGTLSITAYRFALVGNEMQLDLTVTRTGSFSDQVVVFGVSGTNYSAPWSAADGLWSNP